MKGWPYESSLPWGLRWALRQTLGTRLGNLVKDYLESEPVRALALSWLRAPQESDG